MENHPIPQDITGFQFKLIGNMTVRQFSYLATGTLFAWLFFFIFPLPFLIKLPISLICLGAGASVAFLPIDGRPMDTMIINFFKAIFAPTQYIYQKKGGDISSQVNQSMLSAPIQQQVPIQQAQTQQVIPQQMPEPQAPPYSPPQQQPEPQIHLSSSFPSPAPVLHPALGFDKVIDLGSDQDGKQKSGSLDDIDKSIDEEKIEENEKKLEGQVESLKKELEETKKQEKAEADLQAPPVAHQKAEELEKLLEETARQKDALEKELLKLRSRLESQTQQTFSPSTVAAPLPETQRVRKVPHGMEKSVGLPNMPQEPNLITGIVKDPRNNPLPNILVEVKDPEDNPVRAFKTNGLGRFASATSLSNGKYIVIFEDPKSQHKFDAVQIEATGAPIMPLEIISIDSREELRRELFN